jgi:parvulin-like peptidyl-prolyl isomerase
MKHPYRFWPLAILLGLTLTSCEDDPVLVEKREKQRAEIIKLKGELALIDERIKNMPPDVSEELAAAKKLAAKNTAEVENLETEVAALEARRRSMQDEFDAYRIRYQAQ